MTIFDEPNEKELRALLAAGPGERFDYFVGRVAVTQNVWLIFTEGNVLELRNQNGDWMMPVWPFKAFADEVSSLNCRHLKDVEVQSRRLDVFTKIARRMIEEEYSTIGVFPNVDGLVKDISIDVFSDIMLAERRRSTVDPSTLKF